MLMQQKPSGVVILLVLMTSTFLLTPTQQTISPSNVVDIVGGLIDGVVGRDDLEELKQCFSGTEDLARLFDVAVRDFKDGSIAGISQAFLETGEVMQKLPASLQRCVNISNDVQRFVNWSKIFLQPGEIAQRVSYNMLFKFHHINSDINEALKQWDLQNYFKFGESLGEALVMAISAQNGEL